MPTIWGLIRVKIFHGCVSLLYLETKKEKYPFLSLCVSLLLARKKIDGLGGTLHPLRSHLSRQVVHTVFLLITCTCEGNFFINEDTLL